MAGAALDAERRRDRRCSRTTRSCGCRARSDAEFIQMLPFTPRRKDNLAAWMVARSDGEHYGQLLVFQFPKQKLVFGPRQIVGAHQSGPGDLAADHAVEPAGLAGDPGHAARDSDRGVAALRAAAVPAVARGPHPRAQAGHRRVSEPDRDGRDADARARRRSSAAASRPRSRRIGSQSSATSVVQASSEIPDVGDRRAGRTRR